MKMNDKIKQTKCPNCGHQSKAIDKALTNRFNVTYGKNEFMAVDCMVCNNKYKIKIKQEKKMNTQIETDYAYELAKEVNEKVNILKKLIELQDKKINLQNEKIKTIEDFLKKATKG